MSAPPGVTFIDGSVKPPVNDRTQVGDLVQLRPDAVPNLRQSGSVDGVTFDFLTSEIAR